MTNEQLQNAQLIIAVGQSLGANEKQLLAALEAALVESSLRNLNYGDRDSIGLFQQRTSQGWGSVSEILDPNYAARAFFQGAGTNAGVFSVSQSGSAGQMAQRVQRSAFPGRYDQHEAEARSLLSQLGGATTTSYNGESAADYSSSNSFPSVSPIFPDVSTGLSPVAVVGIVAVVALAVWWLDL